MLLAAETLLTGSELLRPGWIEISQGAVRAVGAGAAPNPADRELGAVTVVVGYLLVRRLAGPVPALLAGLVLVTDPFVLRMDGRVMIETPAGLAVLTGWLLVLRVLDREPGRARTYRELAAGLAPARIAALVALSDAESAPALDTLAASDREERLAADLEARGVDDAWPLAGLAERK